ncbi:MAG TPA: hypothetical protein H9852_03970 [Candidatus Mediterraneibacter colneyensis]|nr:hypothetical protein [Candidatus Mediterraneibacter colneyensis]
MDFLNGRIKTIYFRYLSAAFGSALITSIYSIVDMAMVGQYHGPEGSAALAVVAPVWNIIYSFGLLMGIGGSVLFSTIRGKADGDTRKSNEYFTASVIGSVILAAVIWIIIILFDRQLLIVFGAQDNTLTLAREYVLPIKFAIPFFLFNQMLAAYLRNDKNPALATGAVLAGGIFNIFGDYFFVFTCDMGAFGAGLATAIGSTISFLAMMSHFFTKKNTLRLVKPEGLVRKLREIAPTIFRCYGLSFLLLPLNIFSTYYFQALMKPKTAFVASVARGLVVSGILIYLLPAVFTGNAIWFAMPVTELIVAAYVVHEMIKYTKQLSTERVDKYEQDHYDRTRIWKRRKRTRAQAVRGA